VPLCKRAALVIYPPIELGRAGETESVEKRAAIELHGALEVSFRECVLEARDVACRDVGVEPQFLDAE